MHPFFQRTSSLILSCLAGLCLFLAWPPLPTFVFSFFGFALLFIVEQKIPRKFGHFFWHVFLALFIWNVATTYWVFNATPFAIFAWLLNTLLMTLPWLFYRWVKRQYSLRIGLIAFTAAWLTLEWLHFNWELAWPWLALGNVFAKVPNVVQWYEFTGTGGGTLWVIVLNIFVFLAIIQPQNQKKFASYFVLKLVGPILVSLVLLNFINDDGEQVNVSVIQPNVNPYTRDYSYQENLNTQNTLLRLGNSVVTKETDLIIFPESSLPSNPWVQNLNTARDITQLKSLLQKTDNGSIIIGADVLEQYSTKKTATARYAEGQRIYYDVYNADIFIPKTGENEFYAKSKLVPGVERMPYPKQLQFLQKLAIDLGGIGGSRGTQRERTVFTTDKNIDVGSGICYESVFGDYMNDFVKNGAEILVIITNDGWWKNTSGYRQHLLYARLRAIETRRDIARSANTGVSAFINRRGEIISKTEWWEQATLTAQIKTNQKITFYTKYGDYIYRVGLLLTCIIGLITFVKKATKQFKYR